MPGSFERPKAYSIRIPVLLIQIILLLTVVLPMTGSAFRENDAAAYVSGAHQLLDGEVSFFRTALYNYDKQYGAYALLTFAQRLFQKSDPVLVANASQVLLVAIAMLACAIAPRGRKVRLTLLLPVLLCPIWLFSAPFYSPASISVAFLILCVAVLDISPSGLSRVAAPALALLAVICRADAMLLLPVIVWSRQPRSSLPRLILRPRSLAFFLPAAVGVIAGRLLITLTPTDRAELFFNGGYFILCVMFGFGTAFIVYAGCMLYLLRLTTTRPRWTFFYISGAVGAVLPFAYYAPQLYSPRYFFLSNTAAYVLITSRRFRSVSFLPDTARLAAMVLGILTLAPWVIGLYLPSLSHPRITFTRPTRFPTADGATPMGGYLGFVYDSARNGLNIDHNQNIWLAARSTNYQTCAGRVPIFNSPMANYLELAARLHGQAPLRLSRLTDGKCGFIYADLRSLVRRSLTSQLDNRPSLKTFPWEINPVSNVNEGQPIVQVVTTRGPGSFARLASFLRSEFKERDFELFLNENSAGDPPATIPRLPWATYVVFAEAGYCHVQGPEFQKSDEEFRYWVFRPQPAVDSAQLKISCDSSPLWGYAREATPSCMR